MVREMYTNLMRPPRRQAAFEDAGEFSDAPFERGTIGMARAQSPDSADSQFFICFEPASHLNGQYTVVGKVTDGMEAIDKLAVGEPPQIGRASCRERV